MQSPAQGRGTRLGLGLAAVTILGAAAVWSQRPPADTPPDAGAGFPLRALGAVQPRLSPDGKSVAFSYQGAIWRMGVEDGIARRQAGSPGFQTEPCWSPDGRRIAFLEGQRWGRGEVRVIDAGSGEKVPLPRPVYATGPLHFTADGKGLLGYLRGRVQVEAFRVLDLKTGKLTTLQRRQSRRQPWALSADGKRIAYTTTMDVSGEQGGNDGPQVDVWLAALASDAGEPEKLVRFPARIHSLCWSHDGQALYVSTELGGVHNDLYRVPLGDPERPVKLTFGQADEDRPSVSADGRWLLYADNREGCPALVLRDLRSHDERSLSVRRLDYGVPTGHLCLKVREKGAEGEAVARVSLRHTGGGFVAPPGALWRVHVNIGHFYINGHAEFDLPAGTYTLRAFHGPEYRVAEQKVEVKAGGTVEREVILERWADPPAKGWFSGDNHIHPNYGYGEYYNAQEDMARMCAGEGLHVCNLMVANSDGDGVFDREYFRGRLDPRSRGRTLLYWNEEYRSTVWGHMTLVNLRQLVEPIYTGFKDTTNPYDIPTISAIAERTHRQGGLVNYTHPSARPDDLYRGAYTAKGLPVYAALGKIDSVDIMGSNDRASTALYHRLLNCGFRLSASAGTDCFLNRINSYLPGAERVYVKVEGPLEYRKWIEGLRAGRSFASNGPVLELSVNGTGLGGEVRVAGGKVRIRASASSQYPLDRVEVLYNGKVAARAVPAKGESVTKIDEEIAVDRSGWIALRAVGPDHADVEGPWVYAHTSPVYVTVAGKPAGSAEDARYFLGWIDRLWAAVEARDRIPGEGRKAEVKREIDRAREVFRKIIERAGENEGG
jgi:TolB protein